MAGAQLYDEKHFTPGLGLWPATIIDEYFETKAKVLPLVWRNGLRRNVYFQDGPRLPDSGLPHTKIWARYGLTGDVAAVQGDYGHGRVGLIGPHLEADSSWFVEDHLQTPTPLSTDLFREFVQALLSRSE